MKTSSHVREELVRLFVAVELNETTRKNLADEQAHLMQAVAGVKWVSPALIHMTVVFLGDVFAGQIEGITNLLDTEADITPPFAIEVAGLGSFGTGHTPRVIWVGVKKGAEEMASLQGGIDLGLRSLHLSLESRPFHPHFTLGRVKTPREARGLAGILNRSVANIYGVVTVDRILLMRSELHSQGPVHTVLHESALKGTVAG